MKKGKIIILSGPSGSGKTTLHHKLLASPSIRQKLIKTISVTTRPRRTGERQGRDYFFVSKKMFCYKKRRGHFLESEKVFGNFYGTTNQNMTAILRSGKNALLCIDVKGAKTVRRKFPEAVTVFIKAPTMKALEERLKARGTEKKSAMRKRLRTARAEMREEKKYKYVVVNDTLSRAFKQLRKIVLREVSAKSRG